MLNLGWIAEGVTINIPWDSFAGSTGASVTASSYVAADVIIFKDGSTTQRSSASGITASTDFDSRTGLHLASINLADNTDAGFYAAGSEFLVAVDAVTIDSQTVRFWIARFYIGMQPVNITQLLGTAWLTPAVAGTPDVNAKQFGGAPVTATTSVTIPAASTLATTAGAVGSVTGAVGSVTGLTASNLDTTISSRASAANLAVVQSDTDDLQTRIPAALVSGRMDASVGAMAADVLTSSALAASAVTEMQTGLATPTNITGGTITTVTNLTNAPTAGDFTAAMKASITSAVPTAAAIGTAVWAVVANGSYTAMNLLRGIAASAFGKLSGAATTTVVIRDPLDSKDVITATVDASGNRSAVTQDLT